MVFDSMFCESSPAIDARPLPLRSIAPFSISPDDDGSSVSTRAYAQTDTFPLSSFTQTNTGSEPSLRSDVKMIRSCKFWIGFVGSWTEGRGIGVAVVGKSAESDGVKETTLISAEGSRRL